MQQQLASRVLGRSSLLPPSRAWYATLLTMLDSFLAPVSRMCSVPYSRELLAALVALVEAGAMLCAFQLGHMLGGNAAMRADGALWPNPCLKPLAGFGFVLENRVLQDSSHGKNPS